jgi:predicted ATPase
VRSRVGRPRGEVPKEPAGFIGRESELHTVGAALEWSPLVTLTGPGGVGKTRLALRAAYRFAARFPGGLGFVELSGLHDGDLLAGTIADALGLSDETAAVTPESLAFSLRDRRFLLVLDTCEHHVHACAALVASLVKECRDLRVLVTSRQALGVGGEVVLPVPPLPLPCPDDDPGAARDGAVALFVQRAALAEPGLEFTAAQLREIAALCRRLDGIPLAIELAAGQLRRIPLDQLVEQIDGLFWTLESAPAPGDADEDVRHRSLRTTVGWSHELCAPLERLLWARLSVFVGGFDLDMAVQVCADERLGRDDIATCLAGLVEKSIVQRSGDNHMLDSGHAMLRPRYDMLDTIREYGAVWLDKVEGVVPVLERHRDCVAALAARASEAWMTNDQLFWARRMDAERDNVRSALDFCFRVRGQEHRGLRIASTMWRTWLVLSRYTEGRHWLSRGLDMVDDPVPERAEALWQYAYLLTHHSESERAVPLVAESMKLADQLKDSDIYARALRTLGTAAMFMGEFERAERAFAEAAQLMELPRMRADLTLLHVLRAYGYANAGALQAALAEGEAALELVRDAPADPWIRSWAGYVKAFAYLRLGDAANCAAELHACLEMFGLLDDPVGLANCCELLGWLRASERRYAEGATLFGAASRYPDPSNVPRVSVLGPENTIADLERRAREALGQERFEEHWHRGRSLTVEETVRLAKGERLGP